MKGDDPRTLVPVGRTLIVHWHRRAEDPDSRSDTWRAVVVAVGARCETEVVPGDQVAIRRSRGSRSRGDLLGDEGDDEVVSVSIDDVVAMIPTDVVARIPDDGRPPAGDRATRPDAPSGDVEALRARFRECEEAMRRLDDERDRMHQILMATTRLAHRTRGDASGPGTTLDPEMPSAAALARHIYAGDCSPASVTRFVERWGPWHPEIVEALLDELDPSRIPGDHTAETWIGRVLLAATRSVSALLESESRHRFLIRLLWDLNVRGVPLSEISRIE